MGEFKFACPHCGQHFQCGEAMFGHETQCVNSYLLLHITPQGNRQSQANHG